MTDRKPDVLPVEGASIADALAHANTCEFAHCCGSPVLDINIIRSALKRAAAEWEALPNAPAFTVLSCVYCGQEYPAGTPASGGDVAALTGHIAVCEKHPMRGLKAEVELLRKQLSDACDTIRNLVAQKHCANCLAALPAPPKGSTP